MKLGFVTCVQLGLSCMQAIYQSGGALSLAMTLPDDRALAKSGRVFLDDFCAEYQIPLIKSPHVNNAAVIEAIRAAAIDWLFIIGWSQIAGPELLAAPKQGVLGMHPTLLPQGRGRAAIPWAILKKLDKTGVTLFKLDQGVDTGPIAAQQIIPLAADETATTLYARVDQAHVQIMKDFIPKLLAHQITLLPQDETLATEWPGRRPEDGQIDPTGSVWEAERLVRAVTRPYPGAFYFEDGKKVVVWQATVSETQPLEGKFLKFTDGFLRLLDIDP